jgi:hypothetical protein
MEQRRLKYINAAPKQLPLSAKCLSPMPNCHSQKDSHTTITVVSIPSENQDDESCAPLSWNVLLRSVAPALQPFHLTNGYGCQLSSIRTSGGNMFARMTIEDRFLGFDTGDWAMLFGGFLLAAFIALLV